MEAINIVVILVEHFDLPHNTVRRIYVDNLSRLSRHGSVAGLAILKHEVELVFTALCYTNQAVAPGEFLFSSIAPVFDTNTVLDD